ncbi:hypothetical protein BGW36DRAFT_421364 [Talaromyces proteolyticus]|uniref:Fungal N-terminal domain-containing protein n=1 Tax=Talaromyces proteolyticus TaxID=1131652 RepID=A0AAD4Q0R7_9EURO|nr:uncharacterized protein BGW36DRAFT_421364 [Talaromyces proteolyticus]KAH8704770.1 hypothetical protein BGW36DRAFT_421364 [Talaromyces proteolyticus]
MADAFSIAGTAAGVISLGLSVCQGLLAYYGEFKLFHEQIDEVTSRISSLDGILNTLQNMLINAHLLITSPTAQSTAIAVDSIIRCRNGLQRLQKMLEKCQNTTLSNNLLGANIQVNRMLYPFRRATLIALMETINWLQANLSTSLQMLNISMLIVSQRQIDLVLSSSSSKASNIDEVLVTVDRLDQGSGTLNGKLDMIEQHIKTVLITGWQEYSYQWDSFSWHTWRIFIKDLLRNGLLPDHVNDRGETPADRMIQRFEIFPRKRDLNHQQATIDICSDFLGSGGHMTHLALNWRHHQNCIDFNYYSAFYRDPSGEKNWREYLFEDHSIPLLWKLAEKEGIDDIDLPEELLPLVNRSKKHLQVLRRKGIDMHQWVDSYTHWPAGLDLLLLSGYIGWQTLRAACEAGSEDSVKMLIRSTRCPLGPDAFQVAANHPNSAIREIVIHGLIERRKRLKVLAETFLSDQIRYELGITPDTLLGFDAYGTYQALKALPFSINDFYEEYGRGWSVYSSTDSLELADRLWNAGFRDVDEMDKTGNTCLTRMRWSFFRGQFVDLLNRMNWFISKGADINRKISSSSTLHTLGLTVGEAILWAKDTGEFASQLSQISEECKTLLRRIICDDIRDNCCCPYSLRGCSAFTRLLGGLFPTRSDIGTDELIPRLTMMLEALFDLQESRSQEYFAGEIVPCVLRFMTSRSLGISHTCHHERYEEYEPDEIREIQDEEKHFILESDQLFEEFLSKYKELSLDFPDFLARFWWTRMNEILSSRKTLSAEEISQLLETGVILYK